MEPTNLYQLPLDLYSRNFAFTLIAKELANAQDPKAEIADQVQDPEAAKTDQVQNSEAAKAIPSDVLAPALAPAGSKILYLGKFAIQTSQFLTANIPGAQVTVLDKANFKKLPFNDGDFDFVIAADFLEHMGQADRPLALEELQRISNNFIIIAAPFYKNYNENIENIIRQQYLENAGSQHPLLIEHQRLGLPNEDQLKTWLTEKNLKFTAYGEGNISNWMLQQLLSGAKLGEPVVEEFSNFQEYANRNFDLLGNFKEPTYRTIYCISKNDEIPHDRIKNTLGTHNQFSIKNFSYLLKLAFTELRKLFNRKRKELRLSVTKLAEVEKLSLSTQTEFVQMEAKKQKLESLLLDCKKAIQFLRAVLQEKSAALDEVQSENQNFKDNINEREQLIEELLKQLFSKEQEYESLFQEKELLIIHIQNIEKTLKEKNELLDQKNLELNSLQKLSTAQKKSLDEILASRSWKVIAFFKKLNANYFQKAFNSVKNKIKPAEAAENILPDGFTPKHLGLVLKEQEMFSYKPVISIVMPVYNVPEELLVKAIESVKKQTYNRFELCICDDGSTAPNIKPLLEKYAAMDKRIKVQFKTKNRGAIKASNEALKLATGGYVGLLDNKDELTPDALFEVVKALQSKKLDFVNLNQAKNASMSATDEDVSAASGAGGFAVYRRKILNEVGGFHEKGSFRIKHAQQAAQKTTILHSATNSTIRNS
ncbi:MAG: glycosyltransferase [Candidatus Gracilibacteria bacterium]|jgi:hypothetical protein